MPMTPPVAHQRILRDLTESEMMLDQLIIAQARLLMTAVQARIDADAPMAVAQPTLLRLAKFQQDLVGARSELIRTHGELRKVGEARNDVAIDPCPPSNELDEIESSTLTVAA